MSRYSHDIHRRSQKNNIRNSPMKTFINLIAALMILLIASALGAEELNYNLINLSGEAETYIDNDMLIVTMTATADSDTASDATRKVNDDMSWAIEQLEGLGNIKIQTMNYQTHPKYQSNAIIGWTTSQHLRLESADIDSLSGITGKLQQRLLVSSMGFEASYDRKKEAADTLIRNALATFRAKAKLIAETIGAKDYRLVTLSVGENTPHPAPYQRGFQMEAAVMSKASAPQVTAGESKVSVRVDGTIQLIY